MSVGFFVNGTDFAGSEQERFVRVGTIDDVYVELDKPNTTSFTWNTSIHGGDHLLVAVADPDEQKVEIVPIVKKGCFHCFQR